MTRKTSCIGLLLAAWLMAPHYALPAAAQAPEHRDHQAGGPVKALPERVATLSDPFPENGWPEPVDDSVPRGLLRFDLLEYQATEGPDPLRWDIFGWYGGDINRFWIKSEGRSAFAPSESDSELEIQALYGKLISPFFDLQAGVRVDPRLNGEGNPARTYAVLGLQGLAPYQFEVEPIVFLSDRGQLVGRFTGTYDILFSQRLILQPRVETNIASKSDEEIGSGSGVNDLEFGVRLRYEIRRRFAPYMGVTWRESFGTTHRLSEEEGGDGGHTAFVAGVRLWF